MPRYITEKGIEGRYRSRLELYEGSTWIDRASIKFDSNEEVEDYAWLGTPPGLSEVKGEYHVEKLREFFYQIRNREYRAGLGIPRKLIERDKTGQVDLLVDEFVARCGAHWMELLSALLLAGTGSALGNCYDGHVFFDTNHNEGKSGDQKNLLTATEVAALNVAVAAAPTPVEGAKAILGVIGYMMAYLDDQAKPMNAGARQFMVMTSPVLWQFLAPALYQPLVNAGESNPLIAAQSKGGFSVPVIEANPLLTYTTQFLVFRTDAPLKPLIRQDEMDVDLQIIGEGSEEWKKNGQMLVLPYARRAVGYGRWQYAAHATLSHT